MRLHHINLLIGVAIGDSSFSLSKERATSHKLDLAINGCDCPSFDPINSSRWVWLQHLSAI